MPATPDRPPPQFGAATANGRAHQSPEAANRRPPAPHGRRTSLGGACRRYTRPHGAERRRRWPKRGHAWGRPRSPNRPRLLVRAARTASPRPASPPHDPALGRERHAAKHRPGGHPYPTPPLAGNNHRNNRPEWPCRQSWPRHHRTTPPPRPYRHTACPPPWRPDGCADPAKRRKAVRPAPPARRQSADRRCRACEPAPKSWRRRRSSG